MKIAIVLLFLATVLPIYGQEKHPQPSGNGDHATEPNKHSKAPSTETVNVINQQAPPVEEKGTKEHPQGYFSRLLAPENLPNIALFLVGVAGIGIAIRTLRAIESQTKAMVAGMRQWVTIQAFEDTVAPIFEEGALKLHFHLSFEITNPTGKPLTLEWYVISINAKKYSSRLNFTLVPGQVHRLKSSIDYTDEMRNKYTHEGYTVTVTGVIAFTDALTDFQKQRFGYVLKCRPVNGETLNYQGPLPDEDIEKEEAKDSQRHAL
jgi:hypothetical protein